MRPKKRSSVACDFLFRLFFCFKFVVEELLFLKSFLSFLSQPQPRVARVYVCDTTLSNKKKSSSSNQDLVSPATSSAAHGDVLGREGEARGGERRRRSADQEGHEGPGEPQHVLAGHGRLQGRRSSRED